MRRSRSYYSDGTNREEVIEWLECIRVGVMCVMLRKMYGFSINIIFLWDGLERPEIRSFIVMCKMIILNYCKRKLIQSSPTYQQASLLDETERTNIFDECSRL